jgi:DNA-binding response OmpR family regulator
MMKARILWVEGKRAESPPFVPGLRKKGFIVETVSSGKEALSTLSDFNPDVVIVNAASLHTSGRRMIRSLRAQALGISILLILDSDHPLVNDPDSDAILVLPFTERKLINRIRPLLPGEGEALPHKGPIHLYMERKQVHIEDRKVTLTPKVAILLKLFMEHPGEVLERERIFREIWNTEYIGDTRTLDVHISWLRQAIEENPREPRFLKTIRGLGYRFDL